MYLKLEGVAGDHIEHTAATMSRIAKLLQLSVKSKFNDVTLYIGPTGSAERLVEAFQREIKSDRGHKFAVG